MKQNNASNHSNSNKNLQSRLNWILSHGRDELYSLVTVEDFTRMVNTFQAKIFHVNDLENLTGVVLDDLGYEDIYPFPEFAKRLMSFSPIQTIALREMVERFWYQIGTDGLDVHDFLIDNGVL